MPPWNTVHKAIMAHVWYGPGGASGEDEAVAAAAAATAAETTQTPATTATPISGAVDRPAIALNGEEIKDGKENVNIKRKHRQSSSLRSICSTRNSREGEELEHQFYRDNDRMRVSGEFLNLCKTVKKEPWRLRRETDLISSLFIGDTIWTLFHYKRQLR
jgi:hypothetical protein